MENTGENTGKVRVHPALITRLVEASWSIAHNELWHGFPFTEEEINKAKHFIRQYYEAIPAEAFQKESPQHYLNFYNCIRLARKQAQKHHHNIAHPLVWLNPDNPRGFKQTKLYQEVIQKVKRKRRKSATKRLVFVPLRAAS